MENEQFIFIDDKHDDLPIKHCDFQLPRLIAEG